jgi:hypothetical protein
MGTEHIATRMLRKNPRKWVPMLSLAMAAPAPGHSLLDAAENRPTLQSLFFFEILATQRSSLGRKVNEKMASAREERKWKSVTRDIAHVPHGTARTRKT